jgi:excisionase family DNA binding protein
VDLFSVEEAAKMTGMSSSWWRQRVFRREIKFLKIGSRVLIPRSTIDELINRSIVDPVKTTRRNSD